LILAIIHFYVYFLKVIFLPYYLNALVNSLS
jgi:hypothetical protein